MSPVNGLEMTPDGEPLRFRVFGEGSPPLLIFNGLVSSDCHWRFFVPHFERRHAVISWDYRGHGGMPPPADPGTVSVEQFAEDAHTVLRATARDGAVLVGLSFGVQVALECYLRHRDAVRGLVLICGTAGHPLDRVSSNPLLRRFAAALLRASGYGGRFTRPAFSRFLRSPWMRELTFLTGGAHRDECPQEVLDELFAHVASLDPRVIAEACASYLEHSARDALETVEVPTLIIAGDADQLVPISTAEWMHAQIPDSTLVVIEGHSHLAQVEVPDEVHRSVESFLDALER